MSLNTKMCNPIYRLTNTKIIARTKNKKSYTWGLKLAKRKTTKNHTFPRPRTTKTLTF